MESQFSVYFAGEILAGQDPATVRQNVAKLFSADEPTLARLFSGKTQVLKKACDEATARKYQQAMARAGAKAIVKPAALAAQPADAMTKADRIAAIAAAPAVKPPAATRAATATIGEGSATSAIPDEGAEGDLDLAPPGTEVLRPAERTPFVPRDIDTATISLAEAGARLAEEAPPPPPAPTTDHLTLGALGEEIPHLESPLPPPEPNIDGIQLAPPETDLSDCAVPAAVAPDLDLSQLELADAGADVLEAQYRPGPPPEAPDTAHIRLEDAD